MNAATIFIWLNLALVGALILLLPYFTPRRYFFTITVPPGFPDTEAARSVLRAYHQQVAVILLISTIIAFALSKALAAAFVLPSLGAGAAFLSARAKIARYSVAPGSVREAGLSGGEEDLPRWMLWALPPFLFPIGAAAWLHTHWSEIPARFAVHFDWNGTPNRWVLRTERGVYGPLLFSAALLAIMLLISLAVFYGSRRSAQRYASSKLIIASMYFLSIVFAVIALISLWRLPIWLYVAPAFLFSGCVLFWSYRFLSAPGREAEATPDACWHLGQIYYNRDDPALFVQRRLGLGYTVNLGNRWSWPLMGTLLVAVAGMIFLLPR